MGDTVAKDWTQEFTMRLSPRNILYINDRAKTEGIQPSEMIDRIIDTSRTLYRSPVGESHKEDKFCKMNGCNRKLRPSDLIYCVECGEEINS